MKGEKGERKRKRLKDHEPFSPNSLRLKNTPETCGLYSFNVFYFLFNCRKLGKRSNTMIHFWTVGWGIKDSLSRCAAQIARWFRYFLGLCLQKVLSSHCGVLFDGTHVRSNWGCGSYRLCWAVYRLGEELITHYNSHIDLFKTVFSIFYIRYIS